MNVILWDWDNTLADTIEPIMLAFNETLQHYDLPVITREQMKNYMNSAGSQLFLELFPKCDFREVRQFYLSNYQKNISHLALMPGAREILKWTKENGFINIIASNKEHALLKQEVKVSGLVDYLNAIYGADQFPENKPSKVFTDAVLANFPKWKHLFTVGDGASDIKMARHYEKATAILVGTNPKAKEFEQNPPDFWAKDLKEVEKYLNE